MQPKVYTTRRSTQVRPKRMDSYRQFQQYWIVGEKPIVMEYLERYDSEQESSAETADLNSTESIVQCGNGRRRRHDCRIALGRRVCDQRCGNASLHAPLFIISDCG
jgi:hypothetical protein